jgi:hypothetical protein
MLGVMLLREEDIALDDVADCGTYTGPASLVRRLSAAILFRTAYLFVETALICVSARRREIRNVSRRPYCTFLIGDDIRIPTVNLRVEIVVVRFWSAMPSVQECGKVYRDLFRE